MMYSLGAKRRSPATGRIPSAASRRNIASTSCGTIDPPNTRAKASPTETSSLRSMRWTSPLWLLMSKRPPQSLSLGAARRTLLRRVASRVSYPAWYPASAAQRHLQNSENRIGPGQACFQCARQHRCGLEMRATTVVGSTGCFRASGGMADALASGASVLRDVGVQVPLRPQLRCLGTSCTCVLGHRSRVGLWLVVLGRVEVKFSQ